MFTVVDMQNISIISIIIIYEVLDFFYINNYKPNFVTHCMGTLIFLHFTVYIWNLKNVLKEFNFAIKCFSKNLAVT